MGPVGKALTSALVTLGLFAGAEGVLAVLEVPDRGLFDGDPASLWTLRPGLERQVAFPEQGTTFDVRTSVDGYRDDPLPRDTLWVAAMGCSTTFGWGVAEHEAWPAVLERALGVPVLNGGVPGYSTHQALQTLAPVLAARPALVIYGYLVRDAQRSTRPDAAARPTPWLGRTHLARLLTQALGGPGGAGASSEPGPAPGGQPRVAPLDHAANLDALVAAARAQGSDALVLAFPMQDAPAEHLEAQAQVDAARIAPLLPRSAFFPQDPLHLTPDGHRLLAQAIEAPVRALLTGEVIAPLVQEPVAP